MTKLQVFVGTYKKYGSKLLKESANPVELVISQRKKVTQNKSELFLLHVTGSDRSYISSLYPTQKPDVYEGEYNHTRFKLVIENHQAKLLIKTHV